jgi:hypothetical protein
LKMKKRGAADTGTETSSSRTKGSARRYNWYISTYEQADNLSRLTGARRSIPSFNSFQSRDLRRSIIERPQNKTCPSTPLKYLDC